MTASVEEMRAMHELELQKIDKILAKMAKLQPLIEQSREIMGELTALRESWVDKMLADALGRQEQAAASDPTPATARELLVRNYMKDKESYLHHMYDIPGGEAKRELMMRKMQEFLDNDEIYRREETSVDKLRREAAIFHDRFVMGSDRMRSIVRVDFAEYRERMSDVHAAAAAATI